MSGKIHVSISEQTLNIAEAHAFIADPAHGAINSFVGVVRNTNIGREVDGVSYDVFDALAEKTMQQLCEETSAKFDGKINIYLSHYKGKLAIGGVSVIIAVSTPHRAESFDACRHLIEELKHRVPVWKLEHYIEGESEWTEGHSLR